MVRAEQQSRLDRRHEALITLLLALVLGLPAAAEPASEEPIVVTATRIAEDVARVPGSVTIIGGSELEERGVADLRGALGLVAGIDVAPGGDAGPASVVPELWGFKEADAYLLVVDGVPWGGAFSPATASVSLRDVERIEVQRGAAPVMYGATSFVGVIHVIHKAPAKAGRSLRVSAGSFNSRSLGVTASLPVLQSVLSLDIEKQGYRDPRTRYERDHAHWRASADTGAGKVSLNADAALIRQSPAAPHFREGNVLTSKTPLDGNHNPEDAKLDEDRFSLSAGLDRDLGKAAWSILVSFTHSNQRILRGFLTALAAVPDAHGFRESIGTSDLYADSHVRWDAREGLKVVGGVDHLHARTSGQGHDFDYFADPAGALPPSGGSIPNLTDGRFSDQRDFTGLYGFVEWEPHPAWVLEGGARLNRTEEAKHTSRLTLATQTSIEGSDRRSLWHGGSSLGATFRAWQNGRDLANLWLAHKASYKPAAMDFGLNGQFGILAPETGESFEGGLKTRLFEDHLDFDASAFHMDLRNALIPVTIGALPGFTNAGHIQLRGLELASGVRLCDDLRWRSGYSLHDAQFRDFIQVFGGTPTQLEGRKFEMSPRHLFSSGLSWAPPAGLRANAEVNYVGSRWLNKRNTALAAEYATWNAGAGWRAKAWELRVDARNINDQRPAVAESELGDAQYYLLPSRRVDLSLSWHF